MSGKPRVDRSPEEKWQIVQEGIKSGNVSETCRLTRDSGIKSNIFSEKSSIAVQKSSTDSYPLSWAPDVDQASEDNSLCLLPIPRGAWGLSELGNLDGKDAHRLG